MNKKHVKIFFKHNAFEEESIEGAWAIPQQDNVFMLDNILFYATEYSWGDLIAIENRNGELYASKLIKESGHSTIRVLFDDENIVQETRMKLKELGCSSELSNLSTLIAVDIPPSVSLSKIINFLDDGERKGLWEYEEAAIATSAK